MSGTKRTPEKYVLYKNKDRFLSFPFLTQLTPGKFMLLYHDAPMRDPAVRFDAKGRLGSMLCGEPWAPDLKTKRDVPRFRGGGTAPSAIKLSDSLAMIFDNVWYIYNWLGEPDVQVIQEHDWTAILRGGFSLLVDISGDKLKFGKPHRITSLHYPAVSCYDSPIALDENTVLCPIDYDSNCTQLQDRPWETVIMRTEDRGINWRPHGIILLEKDNPGLPKMHSPSVRRLRDGGMICAMQSHETEPNIYIINSEDDGVSWNKPNNSGIYGYNHSLIILSDERVMMTYSSLSEPNLMYRISEDNGKTWPESTSGSIDSDSISLDSGRARCLQLEDGSVFVVYYSHQTDGSRSIMGARITI